MERVHAFTDDALGHDDAVELRRRLVAGEVGAEELTAAAVARAELVADRLGAVAHAAYGTAHSAPIADAPLAGIPTFVKDNTDVRGMPTGHGSEAFTPRPAARDGAYTRQFRGTGLTVLGKSRLPEFGFNASTEFMTGAPARNPWDPAYSVGASSGGSAALVAAGVVPIAHANDGGGSIRIPAAAAGLVGLKPTRGRHVDGEQARGLPIPIISEGVLTRSVRDTAAFVAAMEDRYRNTALPPVGLVLGPARRRVRVGLVVDSVTGPADADTRRVVEATAALLEAEGHIVEPVDLPVTSRFADDFVQYWALLAELVLDTARIALDRSFDAARADGLSLGLRRHHRRNARHTPAALRRLRAVPRVAARIRLRHDVVLSPVVAHTTPLLGHLSPQVEFDTLLARLRTYAGYTPLDNVAGTPAISLPMGSTATGLPVGVQLAAAPGDERTLIELAFQLEAARPFRSIDV